MTTELRQNPHYAAALRVARTLTAAGHEVFAVGGCVRDLLLGISPKDFDIATSARPDQVLALFPQTEAVGAHFGVILICEREREDSAERIATEVATYRHDGVYTDGRRPDSVEFAADARADVLRRDFTVNGLLLDLLAFDHSGNLDASVTDHVGGLPDLASGTLRAIGDPGARFAEDKLRLLRAVRFAARLGFEIERHTLRAIRTHAATVDQVSHERIRIELTRMLTEGHARSAFELLDDTGLLAHILPEVARCKGVPQPPEFHPEGDVFEHTLLLLEHLKPGVSPTLAWGALLHDIGKPATFQPPSAASGDRIRFNGHVEVGLSIAEHILGRLRFSNDDAAQVLALIKNHMRFGDILAMRQPTLKRFLRLPRFEEHLQLHWLDCTASHGDLRLYDYARQQLERTPPEQIRPRPLVTGRDLIAAGYRPGATFKAMLEAAEDAQLEFPHTTRTEILKQLRERFGAPPQSFTTLTSA